MTARRPSRGRLLAAVGSAAVAWSAGTGTALAHEGHRHLSPIALPSTRSALATTAAVAFVAIAVVGGGALVVRLGVRLLSRERAGAATLVAGSAGTALVVAATIRGGRGATPAVAAVEALHIVSAAVWVGAMLWAAYVWRQHTAGHQRSNPVGPIAVMAAGATLVTGAVLAVEHVHIASDLRSAGYGHTLSIKVALVAVTVVLGAVAVRTRKRTRWRWAAPAELVTATVVVTLGGLLTTLPAPAVALSRGTPFVRTLAVGRTTATVLLTPNRPGANIVRVAGANGASVTIDGHPVGAEAVVLDPGTHTLALAATNSRGERGRTSSAFSVSGAMSDVPYASSTSTDCADMRAGAVLAAAVDGRAVRPVTTAECDARQLDLGHAAGHAFGVFLAHAEVRRVAVVSDGSARAKALRSALAVALPAATVVTASSPQSVPDGPLDAVVVATPSGIATRPVATRGTYLAPWLLGPSLAASLIPGGAQVSIALPVDPNGAPAQQFLAANDRFQAGRAPTLAGLLGYLPPPASGRPALRMQLFSPAQISFLPPSLAAGHGDTHDHSAAGRWLDRYDLLPVSTAVTAGD